MLAWILVVFVSVLVHELGHAVVGRLYGGRPEIRLGAFGGVTFPQFRSRPGPARQFVLSFAGPISGLLLGVAARGIATAFPLERGSMAAWIVLQFYRTSIIWAVFNLPPILSLDGGQMMLALLDGVRRRPSVVLASWISVFVSIALGAGVAVV